MIELKYFDLQNMTYADPVSHTVKAMTYDNMLTNSMYTSLTVHGSEWEFPLIGMMSIIFNKKDVDNIIEYCNSKLSGLKPIKRCNGCIYFHKDDLPRYLKLMEQELDDKFNVKPDMISSGSSTIKLHFEDD